MKVAYLASLRGSVIDARVVDDDGVERADLEASRCRAVSRKIIERRAWLGATAAKLDR
jgi:hypothetical protein